MTGKHTPTPWFCFKAGIGEESGDGIVSLWREGEEREANAALIVRAVNAHEALVKAGTGLLTRVDFWHSVKNAHIAIPGEFDDLSDALALAHPKGELP